MPLPHIPELGLGVRMSPWLKPSQSVVENVVLIIHYQIKYLFEFESHLQCRRQTALGTEVNE